MGRGLKGAVQAVALPLPPPLRGRRISLVQMSAYFPVDWVSWLGVGLLALALVWSLLACLVGYLLQ